MAERPDTFTWRHVPNVPNVPLSTGFDVRSKFSEVHVLPHADHHAQAMLSNDAAERGFRPLRHELLRLPEWHEVAVENGRRAGGHRAQAQIGRKLALRPLDISHEPSEDRVTEGGFQDATSRTRTAAPSPTACARVNTGRNLTASSAGLAGPVQLLSPHASTAPSQRHDR